MGCGKYLAMCSGECHWSPEAVEKETHFQIEIRNEEAHIAIATTLPLAVLEERRYSPTDVQWNGRRRKEADEEDKDLCCRSEEPSRRPCARRSQTLCPVKVLDRTVATQFSAEHLSVVHWLSKRYCHLSLEVC
jgi:hypothetical protein